MGTGLNADPQYIKAVGEELREISGFDVKISDHLVDATQNIDGYGEVSSALKVCAMNLSKMANDFRLMASGPRAGLAEISLPAVQPGSSIMPGKVNPVMAEVTNQIYFQVIGNDLTVSLAIEAGQLELNVMGPVLFKNLLESMELLTNGTKVLAERCVKGIKANVERCHELLESSIGHVTALNPYIGYENASIVAKEALTTGKSVREIVLERQLLTEEGVARILDPNK